MWPECWKWLSKGPTLNIDMGRLVLWFGLNHGVFCIEQEVVGVKAMEQMEMYWTSLPGRR
jgi:hypothetical protein